MKKKFKVWDLSFIIPVTRNNSHQDYLLLEVSIIWLLPLTWLGPKLIWTWLSWLVGKTLKYTLRSPKFKAHQCTILYFHTSF